MANAIIQSSRAGLGLQAGALHKAFGLGMGSHPDYVSKMWKIMSHDEAVYRMQGYAGLGLLSDIGENESIPMGSMGATATKLLTFTRYAGGFRLSRQFIDDLQYPEVLSNMMQELGRVSQITRNVLATAPFNAPTGTTDVGFDSVAMLSASHVRGKDNATWSNLLTGDLSEAVLESAIASVAVARDESGNLYPLNVKQLMVHPDNRAEAFRILGSDKRYDTPNNDANYIKDEGILSVANTIVNPYLTDSDAFFLFTDAVDKGMWIDREGVRLAADKEDFMSESIAHKAVFRSTLGWNTAYWVYGSVGG